SGKIEDRSGGQAGDLAVRDDDGRVGGAAEIAGDQPVGGAGAGVHRQRAENGVQVAGVGRGVGRDIECVVVAVAVDLRRAAEQGALDVEKVFEGVGPEQAEAVVGAAVGEGAAGGRVEDGRRVGRAGEAGDLVVRDG